MLDITICTFFILVTGFYLYYNRNICAYAILVTGKVGREEYLNMAIQNFREQDYSNKKLIIIDHSNIDKSDDFTRDIDIEYYNVDMTSLGQLKNIGISKVPNGCYYVPWDDDDIRSIDFISYMVNHIGLYDCVYLQNRWDYVMKTKFSYVCTFSLGMPVYICKKNKYIENIYLEKDSLEDTRLQLDMVSIGMNIKSISNHPRLYLRLIHNLNTSPYANSNKCETVTYNDTSSYKEYDIFNLEDSGIINNYLFKYNLI